MQAGQSRTRTSTRRVGPVARSAGRSTTKTRSSSTSSARRQEARWSRGGQASPGLCASRAASGSPVVLAILGPRADVAQLARASACHAEGRGFESLHPLSGKPRKRGFSVARIRARQGAAARMSAKLLARPRFRRSCAKFVGTWRGFAIRPWANDLGDGGRRTTGRIPSVIERLAHSSCVVGQHVEAPAQRGGFAFSRALADPVVTM